MRPFIKWPKIYIVVLRPAADVGIYAVCSEQVIDHASVISSTHSIEN